MSVVHSTVVPFKAAVTLVTVRVDTIGTVPSVESLVMLNKIFDICNDRSNCDDIGVTKLVEGSTCGTVTFHSRRRWSMASLVLHINISFPPGQSDVTDDNSIPFVIIISKQSRE